MVMTVRDLARHANVSERSFARRFLAETGTTPLRWLAAQRLAIARELRVDGKTGAVARMACYLM
jgi:transcriptional regulator GlxA family with amidase domain